ncbi:MAG: hypothetical protein HY695_02440 [Deltaproteobacteria bacterium]|nr:hypothetical protein [Deltaproteobacteria bacterium]
MADAVNKVVTPFMPVERIAERKGRNRHRPDHSPMSSDEAGKIDEENAGAASSDEDGKKGRLIDIKA